MASSSSQHDVSAHLYTKSPTEDLPVEILLLIFDQCDPTVWARLTLSHTCRRWQHTTLNTSSFWTNIRIPPPPVIGYPLISFENRISILRLQLERTQDHPLDVTWDLEVDAHDYATILCFIREKAPFSRWRSFKMRLRGRSEDYMFDKKNVFIHLESLKIPEAPDNDIMQTLCQTTTSNLRTLNLRWSHTECNFIEEYCAEMLGRVTHLFLPEVHDLHTKPPLLPPNITALEIGGHAVHHAFPHIENYSLDTCKFLSDDVHLKNLTTLTVRDALVLHPEVKVELYGLQYLKCTWITLNESSKLHTPSLKTLHISPIFCHTVYHDDHGIYLWSKAVRHPGLLLSPRESIIVDTPLLEATLTELVAKSDRVHDVSLYFADEDRAYRVVDRIFRTATASRSEPGNKGGREIGLNISTLRLSFGWTISSLEPWKTRATLAVKARQSLGCSPSIYGSWRGEGVEVLLA